jgi:hypothetical protein
MGTCCFTPTKRDFLWWYWLLLASIVGIPMLLAVLYVARTPVADEDQKKRRGKVAASIFWLGSIVVAIATSFVAYHIVVVLDPDGRYSFVGEDHLAGWVALALQFFFATVAANGTDSLVRKRKGFARILLVVLCVAGYLVVIIFLVPIEVSFGRPAIHVMQFLVCMLPAHFWGRFKDSPDSNRAWKALGAFVVAAGLFFLVSYFGADIPQLDLRPPFVQGK